MCLGDFGGLWGTLVNFWGTFEEFVGLCGSFWDFYGTKKSLSSLINAFHWICGSLKGLLGDFGDLGGLSRNVGDFVQSRGTLVYFTGTWGLTDLWVLWVKTCMFIENMLTMPAMP